MTDLSALKKAAPQIATDEKDLVRQGVVPVPRNAEHWLRLGPYYGMFPVEWALYWIHKRTAPGDWILDPFCGRGTSILAAGCQGRLGMGHRHQPGRLALCHR